MHVHKKSLPLASIDEDGAQYTKVDQPIPPFLYQSDTSHTLIYKSEPPFFTFHTHKKKVRAEGARKEAVGNAWPIKYNRPADLSHYSKLL